MRVIVLDTTLPPQNDMWVAATCLVYGLALATLNAKDYLDLAEPEPDGPGGRGLRERSAPDRTIIG